MMVLRNRELTVEIIDPTKDLHLCGPRYCVGGYIWQISDTRLGPLFSGPEYPDPRPDPFMGQGAPEAFFTPLGADGTTVGEEVGVIGIGQIRRSSQVEPFSVRNNRDVAAFLSWERQVESSAVTMRTRHRFREWEYELVRRVGLEGRRVRSESMIVNRGKNLLPIRWFAHPFFPLPADGRCCRFSIPVRIPDPDRYVLDEQGFVCRKAGYDGSRGWYQELELPADQATEQGLTVIQNHPMVGQVRVDTDFRPGLLPVWSNDCTVSFEPFVIRQLLRDERARWSITYSFPADAPDR